MSYFRCDFILLFIYIHMALASYHSAMLEFEIVPDVIDVVPPHKVEVRYRNNTLVNNGNELTPTAVKDKPTLSWNADGNKYYTLLMVDPDAPSRENPQFREVMHWAVVNIPGSKVDEGQELFAYIGSGPPEKTGLHRYVFLIYQQQGKLTTDEEYIPNTSRKNRPSSSARKFATKYNLGQPIAGNFYQAQYDDYVPILHQQLSKSVL